MGLSSAVRWGCAHPESAPLAWTRHRLGVDSAELTSVRWAAWGRVVGSAQAAARVSDEVGARGGIAGVGPGGGRGRGPSSCAK